MIAVTAVSTLIGVAATWFFARWYYRRSASDQTRMSEQIDTLTALVKSLSTHDADPKIAGQNLVVELITALEENRIYWLEFMIAVRAMRRVGDLTAESLQQIFAEADRSGMKCTPQYFAALDDAKQKVLTDLKQKLKSEMKP